MLGVRTGVTLGKQKCGHEIPSEQEHRTFDSRFCLGRGISHQLAPWTARCRRGSTTAKLTHSLSWLYNTTKDADSMISVMEGSCLFSTFMLRLSRASASMMAEAFSLRSQVLLMI